MSVELGFAIVGAVDLALKYGAELRKICSAINSAESELSERTLRLDHNCYKCIAHLEFLKKVHHVLDEGHRQLQERMTSMLVEKLTFAKALLRGIVSHRFDRNKSGTTVVFIPKVLKYAFRKEKLDQAIEALETWQRLSDPTWFLMFKTKHEEFKKVLNIDSPVFSLPIQSKASIATIRASLAETKNETRSLSLPANAMHKMDIKEIPLSCCTVANNGKYILETIRLQHAGYYESTKKNVRNLAERLQHSEPQRFSLLPCKGFVSERENRQTDTLPTFTMVLKTPPNLTNPRSLRDLLLRTEPDSLTERFAAAQDLARAVAYVHIFGLVHKGIRPEAVLNFKPATKEGGGGGEEGASALFLVGFEYFRAEDGRTERIGDNDIEKNLYRHPTRQGTSPSSVFVMQHDIYSLGVCLLEIGLWQSFIKYDDVTAAAQGKKQPTLSPLLGVSPSASDNEVAEFLLGSAKDKFVELAGTSLRKCMGTQYADIVKTCLGCLDPDNGGFGNQEEFRDEDGILVGVRYIEKVSDSFLCVKWVSFVSIISNAAQK
ncbi:hypothetical protein GGS20DRAFT_539798 [Poronia punctata]|nr:hypothetical protein GGS20DRAFT_539798 [Poronia punctata]